MNALRILLRRHRAIAGLALVFVLAAKLLVPAGFMIAPDAKVLTVVICSPYSGAHETTQLVIPMSGQQSGQHDAGKGDPCPYSALSMASTAGADAPLLAAALAFILALGFASIVPLLRRQSRHVRPPLRGPPAVA